MPSLTVMTWNVLHRIHGHNWNEAAVRGEPDEGRRLAGISRLIVEQLGEGPAVVCLQEVSGDQLASLRGQLPPDAALFNHPYPRMPRVKDPASITAPLLTDPSEHLAVVVRGLPSPRVVAARTYPNDQGKGMLVVEAGAFTICCTHVTWAEKGRSQLELLAAQAQGAPGTAIVAGDFNAPHE